MDDQPRDMSPAGIALWGFMSGRYASDDIPVWERRLENERNRVIASGVTGRYVSTIADRIRALPTTTDILNEQIERADKLLASAGFRTEEELYDHLLSGPPWEQRRKWDEHVRQVEREEAKRIAASSAADEELDAAIALLTPEGARKARHAAEDAALDAYMSDAEYRELFGGR